MAFWYNMGQLDEIPSRQEVGNINCRYGTYPESPIERASFPDEHLQFKIDVDVANYNPPQIKRIR